MKIFDDFDAGADDYTYRNESGPQKPDSEEYMRGWNEAERTSKDLAWHYLNYP